MGVFIVAGIVTYNPDLDRLRENVESISSQVKKVIIFDNGSNNQEEIIKLYKDEAVLITSPENIGIAAALNRLMQRSRDLGATWMLSLDQDSICPDSFCVEMSHYLEREPDFGIVAPVILDRNIGVVGHNPDKEYESVRTCITSGAFTKIEVWKEIGGYDESMFIDSVDFEFCYRVRKAGYKVIQARDVQLLHEIGNSEKRKFLFWTVDVKNHSAFRKYYIARNNVYYPLKHHLWLHFIRGNARNIGLFFIVLIYENNKIEKICTILQGWKDGLKYI
ncbi:MAG: glycosyltransferase family 2 protein [Floccifex sp.]